MYCFYFAFILLLIYCFYLFMQAVRPVSHYVILMFQVGLLVSWSLSILFSGHDLPNGFKLVASISVEVRINLLLKNC